MASQTPHAQMSAEDIMNMFLRQAVADQASDIHIEPLDREMRIRFRIDGVLQEKWRRPLYELESLSNRIKILANLDTSSHNVPQDGRFSMVVQPDGASVAENAPVEPTKKGLSTIVSHLLNREAEASLDDASLPAGQAMPSSPSRPVSAPRLLSLRVSVFPTLAGDAVVLRLMNREDMLLRIDQLGMGESTLSLFKRLIIKDYGMVLITGPSGSGKTTTLYSLLETMRTKEKNIVTLEDPVELRLEDIRQSQVGRELTFASGMRSILRQDPDVIMIGEIRDQETAENAVRASLAGRVVLSTIHANTTLGTIPRLIDMNVDRSLIAYSLNGVVAQRLVRKICPDCRVTYTPHREFLAYFNVDPAKQTFIKGKGCEACRHTGFRGRTGLFEVLYFDDTVQALIIERAPMKELEEYVVKSGIKTLKQDALEKALAGITTLEEAGKVV